MQVSVPLFGAISEIEKWVYENAFDDVVSVPLFGAISEIKKYIIHTSYSSVSVPLFGAISEIEDMVDMFTVITCFRPLIWGYL